MARTLQDQGNEDWTVTKKRRRGVEDEGNEDMGGGRCVPKVRHHSRGIPHGGGSPGGPSPQVSVDSTDKENEWGRKCHFNYKGRQIKKTSCRTENPQRERVLFPFARESSQVGLHHDGSTILRNRRTSSTGQGGTRSLPDDQMEHREETGRTYKHDEDSAGGETTPRQIHQRIRELPDEALCQPTVTVLQLPEVWPPGQDL